MAFFVVKTPSNAPSKTPAYYSSDSSSSDEEQELKKAPIRSSQKAGPSAGVNVGKPVKVKLPVKVKVRKATNADDSDSSDYSFPDLMNLIMATARMASTTTGICVDWLETSEAHVFTACLGGITKEQLKVQLKGNGQEHILTISGEPFKGTLSESLSADGLIKKHLGERLEPKFSRTFKVGCNLSVDQLTANVEGDFLTVTIPKVTSAKYEARTVNIG